MTVDEVKRAAKRREHYRTRVEMDKKESMSGPAYKRLKRRQKLTAENEKKMNDHNNAVKELADRINKAKPGSYEDKQLQKRFKILMESR